MLFAVIPTMLQEAWQPTSDRLQSLRPLARHCCLQPDVSGLIRRLGIARRGCRAGAKTRDRRGLNVNNAVRPRSADCQSSTIPVIIGNRPSHVRHNNSLQLYHGHRTMSPPRCCSGPVLCVGCRNDRRRNSDRPSASSSTSSRQSSSALITLTTRPTSMFNIGQLNARSLGNKASAVCDLIVEHRLDVLCVVESWHNAADTPSLIAATPPGYCYVEKARPRRAGKSSTCNHGGICVFIRSNFKVRNVQLPVHKTFEALLIAVYHGGICQF